MSYEFLESYKDIKIGDKIRVNIPQPFNLVSIDMAFVEHLFIHGRRNKFTVETIQEDGDGDAVITVREVSGGILGYDQLEKMPASVRVLNWRKL
jgi:hypothetical protein